MIPYRAMLDVPAELLRYLSRLLAAERRRRGTPARSRKLTCRDQAILALRWFRDRTRIEALGRDHGVSRATAYRYVAEAVDVLSEQAPGLPEALERAMAEGVPYVILDGKVFAADRCSEPATSVKGEDDRRLVLRQGPPPRRQRPGRHAPRRPPALGRPRRARLRPRHHRRPLGTPCPPSTAPPPSECPTLADIGYEGAGIGILTPVKKPSGNQELDIGTRTRNALLRDLRCRGERGFALLTQRWAALQHITADPDRTTEITRAALVLTQFEHKYIS